MLVYRRRDASKTKTRNQVSPSNSLSAWLSSTRESAPFVELRLMAYIELARNCICAMCARWAQATRLDSKGFSNTNNKHASGGSRRIFGPQQETNFSLFWSLAQEKEGPRVPPSWWSACNSSSRELLCTQSHKEEAAAAWLTALIKSSQSDRQPDSVSVAPSLMTMLLCCLLSVGRSAGRTVGRFRGIETRAHHISHTNC